MKVKFNSQFKKYKLAALLILIVATFSVDAIAHEKPVVVPIVGDGNCGMSIFLASDKKSNKRILADIDSMAEHKTMTINFGSGTETLDLKSSKSSRDNYPGHAGDTLIEVYEKKSAFVTLNLKSLGLCGDNPKYANGESCEYTAFVGLMTIKTPQGQTIYKITADDGC
jgi:hypothetical protein